MLNNYLETSFHCRLGFSCLLDRIRSESWKSFSPFSNLLLVDKVSWNWESIIFSVGSIQNNQASLVFMEQSVRTAVLIGIRFIFERLNRFQWFVLFIGFGFQQSCSAQGVLQFFWPDQRDRTSTVYQKICVVLYRCVRLRCHV